MKIKKLLALLMAVVFLASAIPSIGLQAAPGNTSFQAAYNISYGTVYTLSQSATTKNPSYFFKTTLPAKGVLTVSVEKPQTDESEKIDVIIYDSNRQPIETCKALYNERANVSAYYKYQVGLNAGDYVVEIDSAYNNWAYGAEYDVSFAYSENPYTETEDNDIKGKANQLSFGKYYRGECDGTDDFFKFYVSDTKKVVRLTIGNAIQVEQCGYFKFINSNTKESYLYKTGASVTNNKNYTWYVLATQGWNYVHLDASYGTAPYSIAVWDNFALPTVSGLKGTPDTYSYTITWSHPTALPKSNELFVQVDRSVDGSSYKFVKYFQAKYFEGIKDYYLENNHVYKYRFRYVYRDETLKTSYKTGAWSYFTYAPMAKVSGVKQSSGSAGSIKLSWSKVSGASGYEIFRSTSKNGYYSKVGTISKNYYTNSKLSANKTYYYKVRAYKKSGGTYYGAFSTPIYAKTATKAPSVYSYKNSGSKKATVKWKTVSSASGYQVYMSTSSKGTYKSIYSGSAKSYTKSGLKKGKTYYFKVRTYKKVGSVKVYSSFSSVKKVKITK